MPPYSAGLALIHETKPKKPEAGDYGYSGVHDQGALPPPREGGPMALLIACVQEAKNANDEYLTRAIAAEKELEQAHVDKRAKTQGS